MRHSRILACGLLFATSMTAVGAQTSAPRASRAVTTKAPANITGGSPYSLFSVTNTGTGAAIYGLSLNGGGIAGRTKYPGTASRAGIIGSDVSTSGFTNDGVSGITGNGGYGVRGASSDGAEGGVGGFATTGTGALGVATSGIGIFGSSGSGNGGTFQSETGYGANISSSSGTGAIISSTTGIGAIISSSNSSPSFPQLTYGALVTEAIDVGHAELLAPCCAGEVVFAGDVAAPGGTPPTATALTAYTQGANPHVDYPIAVAGFDLNNAQAGDFNVDGYGDIAFTGTANSMIRTRTGVRVTAYSAKTTESTVEDTGSSQLVAGAAVVRLDPAYSQSIDLRKPYRVFLTPNGESHGLYVAQKSATAFLVRENDA